MKVGHIVLSLLWISVIAPIFLYPDRVFTFFNASPSRRDFLDDAAAFTLSGDTRHLNLVLQGRAGIILIDSRSNAFNLYILVIGNFHRSNNPLESYILTTLPLPFPFPTMTEHKSTRVLSATNEELHNPIRHVTHPPSPSPAPAPATANLTSTLHYHPNASHLLAISLEEKYTQPSSKIDQKEHTDNKSDRMTEAADAQARHLKDLLIHAKVYLSLPAIKKNPHVTRELRQQIKEVSCALGDAAKDTDLPRNAFDKLKAMEQSLEQGRPIQDDCAAVVKKLRPMLHSTEEQLRVHKEKEHVLDTINCKNASQGSSLPAFASYYRIIYWQQQL